MRQIVLLDFFLIIKPIPVKLEFACSWQGEVIDAKTGQIVEEV